MQNSNRIETKNFPEDHKEKIQDIIEQLKKCNNNDRYFLYRDLVKLILKSQPLEKAVLRLKEILEQVKEDDEYFLDAVCKKFYSNYCNKKYSKVEEREQDLNYCLLLTSSLSQYCNSGNIKLKLISHVTLVYYYAVKKDFENSLVHKEIVEQYLIKLKDFPDWVGKWGIPNTLQAATDEFCKGNRFDVAQELNSLAIKTYLLLPEQKRSIADWMNIKELHYDTGLFYYRAGQLNEAKSQFRRCLEIYYEYLEMTKENFKNFCGFLASSNYNSTGLMHSLNLYKFIYQFLDGEGDFRSTYYFEVCLTRYNIKLKFSSDPNLCIQDLLNYALYIQKNLSSSPWSQEFRWLLKDLYKGMEFLVKVYESKELPNNSVSQYLQDSSNLNRFKKKIEELKTQEKTSAKLTTLIEGHPNLSTGLTSLVVQLLKKNNELSSRIVCLEDKVEELTNNNNNNYESKEKNKDESGKNQSKITNYFQSRLIRKIEEDVMEQNNKWAKLEQ